MKTTDLTEQIDKLVGDHLAQVHAAAAVERAFGSTSTRATKSKSLRRTRTAGDRRDPSRVAELAAACDWLITMGCEEECPVVAGARHADWPLLDPKGLPLSEVRAIRDEIESRVRDFLRDNLWDSTSDAASRRS